MIALARPDYGPIQLCRALDLTTYQRDRAIQSGIIPGPDLTEGRWSRASVETAAARLTPEVRASLGTVPDLGAVRAAEWLTDQLAGRQDCEQAPVPYDTMEELARRGVLRQAGRYKGWPIYDGRDLEWLANRPDPELNDLLVVVAHDGRMRTASDAASYLGIRHSDLDHLVRAGWLRPSRIVRGGYRQRILLYRTGDLRELLSEPELDWAAVRTCSPGHPSPFRHLPVRHALQEGELQ